VTKPAYPSEHELHAFIDDELNASRRAEILAVLREDPALAARVAGYRADRDLLRMALGGIGEQPIPAAWAARIEAATAPRPRVALPTGRLLTRRSALGASVALAASAVLVAWWQWPRGDTVLAEAEAARAGRLGGGGALPAPEARDAELRSALGLNVRAPDLRKFGFQLAGIDLFGRPGGGSAQLRYSDADRRALTIYLRRSDGTVQFDLLRRGKTRICVWQDDVVGAVIIADLSAGEMLRIASSAYTDLNL
jgi:anti-sigma factor RsiW